MTRFAKIPIRSASWWMWKEERGSLWSISGERSSGFYYFVCILGYDLIINIKSSRNKILIKVVLMI